MNLAEYQSPETIEIVTTWGQTVLVVAGVVAAMGAFMRWVGKRWDHRVEVIAERRDDAHIERLTAALDHAVQAMSDRIDQRTQPIQRDANGGNSLPDVFARIDGLDARLTVLATAVATLVEDQAARVHGDRRTRATDPAA